MRQNSTSSSREILARAGALLLVAAAAVPVLLLARSSEAAFPGQNGKIAFDFTGGGRDSEIGTVNPDGTGFMQLTDNASNIDDLEPAWSPDGKRITFTRQTFPAVGPVQTEVWVMNADGTGQTLVPAASTPEFLNPGASPAFSGDGTQITYIGKAVAGDQEVFVTNADGTGLASNRSNAANFDEYEPTYAADNQRIAYERGESAIGPGGAFDFDVIYTMPSSGAPQTARTPTDGSMDAEGPNFSADGSLLTFARCDPSGAGCFNHEIVTMPAGGGPVSAPLTPLVPADFFEYVDPAFSPDGTRIVFTRQPDGPSDLYTVGSAGGALTPLVVGIDASNPDWQPVLTSSPSGGAAGASASGRLCRKVPTTIVGTNGKDFIVGTAGRDVVHGLKGQDQILGLQGDDRLCGGRGWDKIFGDEGDDYLFGGDQHDFLSGGPGIDFLFGGTPSAPIRPIPDTCHRDAGGGKLRNCQKTD